MPKLIEKEKAIRLREKGYSYSEILKEIPVAKSSLSLWLKSVGLAKSQKQRLTKKKLEGAKRGAKSRMMERIRITDEIKKEAANEIKNINNKELWLMGIMLYWAEGSKEKPGRPGTGILFSNSDPYMIKLFLKWLFDICEIPKEKIRFEIYIHENSINELTIVKKYWSTITNFEPSDFQKIYFKKHKIKTNRKNINDDYYGLVRIKVKESSSLNRKISGWIEGILKNCGVV